MMDPSNSNSLERREAKPCEPFAERMYLLAAVELEQAEVDRSRNARRAVRSNAVPSFFSINK